MAVTQQPEKSEMVLMDDSSGLPGCPPGLQYLAYIDTLQVRQQMELFEVLVGWETRNRYVVNNCLGQRAYYAMEESTAFMRQCCGPARAFVLHIFDNYNQEIIRINREFKCCAGCCWCASADCCAYEATVEAPVGHPIGYIRQAASACAAHAKLMDANREPIMSMWAPCCVCQGPCCTADVAVRVFSGTESRDQICQISKKWAGTKKEIISDADKYNVSFPLDLDVKMKAVMLAACFLADFWLFEDPQQY